MRYLQPISAISSREVKLARSSLVLQGIVGLCAHRRVFLGFAPARVLRTASFADILDEESGRGYQRRPNPQHSLDFRRYIQRAGSATIPLTFNARPRTDDGWQLVESKRGAQLKLRLDAGPVLAQVDCQHRLGNLGDLDVSLPFMSFLGLSEREEMEVFNVINSKAKGLSNSLLDFHAATMAANLGIERPELFLALHLQNETESPWHGQLDLGGHPTSGLRRRASLRTMQKAAKRFLHQTEILKGVGPERAAAIVLAFWAAVANVLADAWAAPRRHLLTKGVGVYALMATAADLVKEAPDLISCDRSYFTARLADFLPHIDWRTDGPLQGLGGEAGVKEAIRIIRAARAAQRFRVVDLAQ